MWPVLAIFSIGCRFHSATMRSTRCRGPPSSGHGVRLPSVCLEGIALAAFCRGCRRGSAANVITTIFPAWLWFPVSPRQRLEVCPARRPVAKRWSGIFRKSEKSSGPGASADAPLRAKPVLSARRRNGLFRPNKEKVSRTGKLSLERLRVRQTTMLALTDADYM
jgi:hypothetical protein